MHELVTQQFPDTPNLAAIDDPYVEAPKGRGRQRCEQSKEAILSAVLALLHKMPLRDITIEGIARKAGVGKATIYKWWPSKAHVALDAFLAKSNRMAPNPDTGSAERDFREQLYKLFRFYSSPSGRMLGQFIAEGQSDPEFASLFLERFLRPRRELVGIIFDRGQRRGEIDASLDRELVLDLIYGPAIYRLLTGMGPLDRAWVDTVISGLFRGLAGKKQKNANERVRRAPRKRQKITP
jgi:AcrR family transcriptional regulator